MNFKKWLEDCGEITTNYSNVDNQAFALKSIRSRYTGDRIPPEKPTGTPEKLFKKRKSK